MMMMSMWRAWMSVAYVLCGEQSVGRKEGLTAEAGGVGWTLGLLAWKGSPESRSKGHVHTQRKLREAWTWVYGSDDLMSLFPSPQQD